MATNTHRGTLGSPPGRRIGGRGAVFGIALLVVGAIVFWAMVRDDGKDLTAKEVPAAQAEPAEAADDVGPEVPAEDPAVEVGPFTAEDLEALVLPREEGEGLVKALEYSTTYSGPADIGDVHHWTLVPTEPLERAGFVEAYSAMFMTSEFVSSFASEGRDLATAALLFETPDGARRALQIFEETRSEVWETSRPLPMRGGSGVAGLLGSDNVSVVYPTVGFTARVGNVILLLGSQGGSEHDRPLPVRVVRGIALDLLARAQAASGGAP